METQFIEMLILYTYNSSNRCIHNNRYFLQISTIQRIKHAKHKNN